MSTPVAALIDQIETLASLPGLGVSRLARDAVPHLKRLQALEAALTPSAETKAAYMGEFTFAQCVAVMDEDDDEQVELNLSISVPWDTIKQIMKAIREQAA